MICTPSQNQSGDLGAFCQSISTENVICEKTSASSEIHIHEGQEVKLILKPGVEKQCGFVIDLFPSDVESILDCHLENGVQIRLTFVKGTNNRTRLELKKIKLLLFHSR